ncbi:hypothetical protein GQ53DRAFT_190587 [Thozetella sp. PMI_491]|nr:hypothetical protein GQ53DRAFT_190587 [Thozetella sp. PMI_491]
MAEARTIASRPGIPSHPLLCRISSRRRLDCCKPAARRSHSICNLQNTIAISTAVIDMRDIRAGAAENKISQAGVGLLLPVPSAEPARIGAPPKPVWPRPPDQALDPEKVGTRQARVLRLQGRPGGGILPPARLIGRQNTCLPPLKTGAAMRAYQGSGQRAPVELAIAAECDGMRDDGKAAEAHYDSSKFGFLLTRGSGVPLWATCKPWYPGSV